MDRKHPKKQQYARCARRRRRRVARRRQGYSSSLEGGSGLGTAVGVCSDSAAPPSSTSAQLTAYGSDDPLTRQAAADRLLGVMLDLVGASNAIDLRIARLAAWIKCTDPADCGYASHCAIFREHIGWGDSWLRALVRLVEADLPLIQAAVSLGRLPLSVAVQAPGLVEPSQQSAWLQGALEGYDPGFGQPPEIGLGRGFIFGARSARPARP